MSNGSANLIRVGKVVGAVATITAAVWAIIIVISGEVAWRTNLARDLKDIRVEMAKFNGRIVGQTPEGWHRGDMALWCNLARQANQGEWVCPDPYNQPPVRVPQMGGGEGG